MNTYIISTKQSNQKKSVNAQTPQDAIKMAFSNKNLNIKPVKSIEQANCATELINGKHKSISYYFVTFIDGTNLKIKLFMQLKEKLKKFGDDFKDTGYYAISTLYSRGGSEYDDEKLSITYDINDKQIKVAYHSNRGTNFSNMDIKSISDRLYDSRGYEGPTIASLFEI